MLFDNNIRLMFVHHTRQTNYIKRTFRVVSTLKMRCHTVEIQMNSPAYSQQTLFVVGGEQNARICQQVV